MNIGSIVYLLILYVPEHFTSHLNGWHFQYNTKVFLPAYLASVVPFPLSSEFLSLNVQPSIFLSGIQGLAQIHMTYNVLHHGRKKRVEGTIHPLSLVPGDLACRSIPAWLGRNK
jgi:hypothetical protein